MQPAVEAMANFSAMTSWGYETNEYIIGWAVGVKSNSMNIRWLSWTWSAMEHNMSPLTKLLSVMLIYPHQIIPSQDIVFIYT